MRRFETNSAPVLAVILGAIVLMAIVMIQFDDFYLRPICLRFGEEKQIAAILIPAVWLARRLAGIED